jgi:hypothetical protein
MKYIKQESSQEKFILFSVPFFVIFLALVINIFNYDLYISIFGFDSVGAYGEWFQFVFYIISGIIGILTYNLLRKNGLFKESIIIAIFLICCFFIALEEISYGQWIFKWESPVLFQEINLQKETNLHNTKGLRIHLLYMMVGFHGGFSWVYKRFSKGSLLTNLVCPDWHYASYFLPVLAFYFYYDYIRPHFYIIENHQELFELILSLGFLLLSASNYRKVATRSLIRPTPQQP